MAQIRTQGECLYCKKLLAGSGMSRHLKTCQARRTTVAQEQPSAPIYHLRIYADYLPIYWMHIEIDGRQTLEYLDQFLRDTWLECCGHLSEFKIGYASFRVWYAKDIYGDGQQKTKPTQIIEEPLPVKPRAELVAKIATNWGLTVEQVEQEIEKPRMIRNLDHWLGEEYYMNFALKAVLTEDLQFLHRYDFGSTTELTLKVVEVRYGDLGQAPLRILSRNNPPPFVCAKCGAPATHISDELWELDEFYFCDTCAEALEYSSRLANSPRTGVCGYE